MKRKITACLCGLTMASILAMPVHAEEQTTTLSANVASTYILTIPAETQIQFNATSTDLKGPLKVKGNVLSTENVKVTATCNPLHNQERGTDLSYTLNVKGGGEFSSETWDETELRNGLAGAGKQIELSVAITADAWNQAHAGDYVGSIVFQAELQQQPQP